MKKIVLIAFVAMVASFSANAQIGKGSVLLSGSTNLNFTSISPDGGDNYSVFLLNTRVGYFFIDNFTAGLGLDYQRVDDFSSSGIGIFGRYYVNGKIIVGANLTSYRTESDISGTGLGIEGGYAAFITKNIAIEPTINLSVRGGDYDDTQFGLNVGVSLYLNR